MPQIARIATLSDGFRVLGFSAEEGRTLSAAQRFLAAALAQLSRTEEAKEALDKAIANLPTSFGSKVRERPPWFRPEDHAHMLEGLRKAGWEG
jgi:hypothetical protein